MDVGYFQPDEPIENLTGDLPHWRQRGVTYFVTFRCTDSLPQEKLDLWRAELNLWLKEHPGPHDREAREEFYHQFPARIQAWLDSAYGECPFRDSDNRAIVESALQFFDGQRYQLLDSVVAANHVHALVTPLIGHELSEILHSWKSFSAKALNRCRERRGPFWQKESFDHIVRNAESLTRFQAYIRNHVKSGSGVPPL